MTTQYLTLDISLDEGFRAKAYPDPLSPLGRAVESPMWRRPVGWEKLPGEPWTCGYGCTGEGVGPTTVWTQAEAVRRRDAKIAGAAADMDRNAPWWRTLNDARQDVLVNMAYNMGWPRLSGFKKALAAMKAGDFEEAAVEMLDSRWAPQVAKRARRLSEQMRTGVRAGGL